LKGWGRLWGWVDKKIGEGKRARLEQRGKREREPPKQLLASKRRSGSSSKREGNDVFRSSHIIGEKQEEGRRRE